MRFGTVSLLLCLTKKHYFKRTITRFISIITMGDKSDKKPFERLPNNVVPKNYALTLTPNLKDFTFLGEEVVELEVCRYFIQINNRSCYTIVIFTYFIVK